jgi:hypothetical protein
MAAHPVNKNAEVMHVAARKVRIAFSEIILKRMPNGIVTRRMTVTTTKQFRKAACLFWGLENFFGFNVDRIGD